MLYSIVHVCQRQVIVARVCQRQVIVARVCQRQVIVARVWDKHYGKNKKFRKQTYVLQTIVFSIPLLLSSINLCDVM